MNSTNVRADFPGLRELTYLNMGTHGLMPEPALRRYQAAIASYEQIGYFAHYELEAAREQARARMAALINALPEAVALTGNANDGINLVAAGLAWHPGDEVLVSDQEHPALESPFGYRATRGELVLRRFHVGATAAETLANVEQALSPRTRLLAFSYISCQTGTRLPAAAICQLARGRGVQTLVDGAQALGQFPLDVAALGCDYLASNGHKWLGGPKGTGLFYLRPELLDELRPAHVGAGSLRPEQAAPELLPTAARFEFGTRTLPLWVGMNAALDWWEERGFEPLQTHMQAMSARLKAQVLERPQLQLLTPLDWEDSSALASFRVAGQPDSIALLKWLWEQRIVVRAVTEQKAIRISTACFTNDEDLARLFTALDGIATLHG
ncbi:MAG: aminotransferase class V-fold PLP-dependent enzyme [Chloroflexaceae bacterium]|jgi:selenocysteine lyase/cysteine desulfurase|nr:aminotransferase class V-fold PLP-dependent enzyme [Chloroflexaceae bacterium]